MAPLKIYAGCQPPMSLVEWLKGLTERRDGDAGDAPAKTHAQARPRRARKGGEAYAKEWVKVLEENGSARDEFNTYTWELKPDGRGTASAGTKPGRKTEQPATDPFDTYTWELQETDSKDDPWGLNKDPAPAKPAQKDGVNPYDTGVFDASWTGRFDQR